MLCIRKSFCTDHFVVVGTQFASGVTAGIYKELALLLVRNFFENIEMIIEVIVNNDDMIVLTYLIIELFGFCDTLAAFLIHQ